MPIVSEIKRVLDEYLVAKTQPLRDHPLASVLRDTIPSEIEAVVNAPGEPRALVVQGTRSPGNWAAVPWIGIRDPRLSSGMQRGVYVVILFAENMQNVFLGLSMGVTETPESLIEQWLSEIQQDFPPPQGFSRGPLPDGSVAARGRGSEYERATVYYKCYARNELPSDDQFRADLNAVSELLRRLGDSGRFRLEPEDREATHPDFEDDVDLCLLGTWRNMNDTDAARVKEAIAERGGWASWWSFPIREEYHDQLQRPFFLYLNSGGARMSYRMKVERFRTERGNDGIPSPWPEFTDSDEIGKVRQGPRTSDIYKTWLLVRGIESLQPPLSLDDFEPAPGIPRNALLNQAAFGYAYLGQAPTVRAVREVTQPATSTLPDVTQRPTNLIWYGPPGTGKTHLLRSKFEAYTDAPTSVDEESWLEELMASYGWREVIASALADFGGPARVPQIREHRWVKGKAKQRARTTSVNATLWRILQAHAPLDAEGVHASDRRPPFIFLKTADGSWSLTADWRDQDDGAAELLARLSAGPTADRRPVYRYRTVTFHPSFSYEDFIRGIRPTADSEDGQAAFKLVDGVFKQICDEAKRNPNKRYALFIDEINRANIAKVFGELITLVEVDKRAVYDTAGKLVRGMVVQLAGGVGDDVVEAPFGVPWNLDIFGTMNTADRSIALLDIALRRRFEFSEMEPDYDVIKRQVASIDLALLLRRINDRLEYLLDRDHRIGHAYLISVESLAELRRVFQVQIVPLLQEYFFDDMSRVQAVLGTSAGAPPFIVEKKLDYATIFSKSPGDDLGEPRSRYTITLSSTWSEDSFRGIYEGTGAPTIEPSS